MLAIIYHPAFETDCCPGGIEGPERVAAIRHSLPQYAPFLQPEAATETDLLLAHDREHLERLRQNSLLFPVVCLAAGGAILGAALALEGKPAFGVIRPPGHHADRRAAWGFCHVNNMAVAVLRLLRDSPLHRVVVADLDHHRGDGTERIFLAEPRVQVVDVVGVRRRDYLAAVYYRLKAVRAADLLAVSMGFDTYERDLGGMLRTEDYRLLGRWLRRTAERLCRGRRFAILEGGYYLPHLGRNVLAFCQGFGGPG